MVEGRRKRSIISMSGWHSSGVRNPRRMNRSSLGLGTFCTPGWPAMMWAVSMAATLQQARGARTG
jgi:hypothetical protein